jgi:hypothetical protein
MSEPERFVDFTVEKINAAVLLDTLASIHRAVAMASSGFVIERSKRDDSKRAVVDVK